MTLSTLLGSIELGLIFAILSLGLFIAFRILDLPDLTVDGSFVTGLAYSAVWSVAENPLMGIVTGAIGGMFAGIVTGILHTKLKIHAILAGILTMTGLYSINLFLMGDKPSIFFYGAKTVFTPFEGRFFLAGVDIGKLILLLIIVAVLVAGLKLFLMTQIGLSLRATGDNEAMVRSSSINTDAMKILGFSLCNLLVAFSGAIYAQYNMTATHGVGTGMLVLGLASIIIGETVIGKRDAKASDCRSGRCDNISYNACCCIRSRIACNILKTFLSGYSGACNKYTFNKTCTCKMEEGTCWKLKI